MKDYSSQIDDIKFTLDARLKNATEGVTMVFTIDYCSISSSDWINVFPKESDTKYLQKNCQEIINRFTPDAIRIQVWDRVKGKDNRHKDNFVDSKLVKITDTYIPLVDQVKPEPTKESSRQPNNDYLGLIEAQKSNELQRIQDKHENTIKFMLLEHRHEVERLNDKIETLTSKISELETEAGEYAEEIEKYQEELEQLTIELSKRTGEQTKAMTLGGVQILGKLMKLEKDEISELMGFVAGGSDEPKQLEEKGGGIELDTTDDGFSQERREKREKIMNWVDKLPEESFENFWNFMITISTKEGAYQKAIEAVMQTENIENKNTEE